MKIYKSKQTVHEMYEIQIDRTTWLSFHGMLGDVVYNVYYPDLNYFEEIVSC